MMMQWLHDPRLRSAVRRCLERNRWLMPLAKRLRSSKSIVGQALASQASVDIYEITPISARVSPLASTRFNLIVPSLQNEHLFGGILTALRFFDALVGDFPNCRLILSDQSTDQNIPNRWTPGYRCVNADADDRDGRLIVPFGDRGHRTLAVRSGDLFVATAWWTAYGAQRLIAWQSMLYSNPALPLTYLIQDHEPGFYPWSSRHALARSTYQYSKPQIAVFNTGLLQAWFDAQGYRFSEKHAFEPHLNPVLLEKLHAATRPAKTKRLLIYGRPETPRNAFELVCLGIREWARVDPEAANWEILSLGESHPPVGLPNGRQIVALGKVSLEQYAEILHSAHAGVSLMLSPHPSYPPLEMAAFGVHTITNCFDNKELTGFSPLIRSLDVPTPEAIAEAVRFCVHAPAGRPEDNQGSLLATAMLEAGNDMFPFVSGLRASLLQAAKA